MGSVRDYAALPHEYLKEMEELDNEEFGRLIRALLAYSIDGTDTTLTGNERFYKVRVFSREDRYQESFQNTANKLSEAGKAGAAARWQGMRPDTTACDRIPSHTIECDSMRSDAIYGNTNTNTKTNTNTYTNNKSIAPGGALTHKHGEYGWVKLTDEQYQKLVQDLGQEELDRCIQYVDESAQKSGNKNKWKDWNLVIRKCSREAWGMNYQQKQKPGTTHYAPADPKALYDLVNRI